MKASGPQRGRSLRLALLLPALLAGLAAVAVAAAPQLDPLTAAGRRLERAPIAPLTRQLTGRNAVLATEAPDMQERLAAYAERQHIVHDLLGGQHVSRKSHDLLRRRGLGPALLAGRDPAKAPPPVQGADTLKILIVRIAFETDRSGELTSVTEDGDFQLGPAGPTDHIDPPPHDRTFFESHLYGLAEFYRFQSGGRLAIRGRVLPEGEQDSYKLSDLADYGPGAGGYWTLEGLESLVRDMIAAADAGLPGEPHPLSLADFDDDDPFSYVIFVHAGSDWQSDVNDDSPNDVPTFFVSLGEPAELGSLDSETGEPGRLSECSVIPETTSQDGLLGSIAAGLYHEFGHALGLVDIYDTTTGLPKVGVWDLMDAGTNLAVNVGLPHPTIPDSVEAYAVVGLLPPSLGAWDKWFLGWLETGVVDGPEADYRLPAVQVPRTGDEYTRYRSWGYDFRLSYPQALVGGVSPDEFFLVENRWVPASGDELPEETGVGFVQDAETDVILYLGGDPDPVSGVPRNTGMYDYFLPTLDADGVDHSGLLIWHVNMARIEPNLEGNTINAWGDGLRLVEADGIQDVGVYEAYVLGFYGSHRDPFNEINGDRLYVEGAPSSRAFDRSWTGLELRDIAGADGAGRAVMAMRGSVAPLAAGAPVTLPPLDEDEAAAMGGEAGPRALDPRSATPLLLATATGDRPALLLADAAPDGWTGEVYGSTLFALRPDGSPATAAPADAPAGAAWRFAAELAGPPQVCETAGGERLVVGLADGTVWALATVLDAAGAVTGVWGPVAVGDSLAWAPSSAGGGGALLCAVPPDTLRWLRLDGALAPTVVRLDAAAGGHAAAPLPLRWAAAGMDESWAALGSEGWQLVSHDGGVPDGAPPFFPYPRPAEGTLHRAQLNGSGGVTLLVLDDLGLVGAWSIDPAGAVTVRDWPGELDGAPAGEPAVADLNGDGRDDLIVATARRVHAFQADGIRLTGWPVEVATLFPLPDSVRVAAPVVVCDADGAPGNELYLATDLGHLIGLDDRGRRLERTPLLWGGGAAPGLAVGPADADAERLLWLLERGGRRAPPLERTWWNGRAVAFRLPGSGTAGQASTEWLGLGGGPARLGQTGLAAALPVGAAWLKDVAPVVLYPNPLTGERLTVRFHSATDRAAHLTIFNLEGEVVARATIPVVADQVVEHTLDLPRLAAGVYVCQLERATARGVVREHCSLAVER